MGHAGAIISGGKGTAAEKMDTMRKAGIIVVESPALIGEAVEKALSKLKKKFVAKKKNAVPKKRIKKSSVRKVLKKKK
jgi:23S rRNA A2030 N6-methylase RlmJ